ncbi:MAG: hypothetical protein IKC87_00060 [Clostridia bacterium]|nr:hypothetical protein [Clostridia bacterium]
MAKNKKNIRSGRFEFYKSIIKIGVKKSEFIYLGDKPDGAAIILSNHVGTSAPLAWELYEDIAYRFWGASEMNGSLAELYGYHTKVYFHGKKHWNIHLARLYCLLASPLTWIFYRGINLISTYQDIRFRKTLSESIDTLKDDKAVIIFPEISDKGYLDELEGFHKGCIMLMKIANRQGLDVPVYVSYYRKRERKYIVDKPIMLSELMAMGLTDDELADMLCHRCNELGKMDLNAAAAKEDEKPEESSAPERIAQ